MEKEYVSRPAIKARILRIVASCITDPKERAWALKEANRVALEEIKKRK